MDAPRNHYWQLRLEQLKAALEKNNFEAHVVADAAAAKALCLDRLIPAVAPASISWGGSMTFTDSGLYKALTSRGDLNIIDPYDKSVNAAETHERRRQAMLTDLYITGTNAVTERGHLVNLDMIGNRVAALTFGPRFVIVLVGRNKIVPDLMAAMDRIKSYAAPVNVMRLDKKTPCAPTGRCHDCKAPDRICNYWTITEKSFPRHRIKVVLINQDMGF
jgi:L-lactate utilization protein LutC